MADGKVSIELAFVQVIALLKKVKRGYSLEDIEAKTGLHVRNNTKLQDLLFNHQHLHWDEKNKLVYKFQHDINNKEELLKTVQENGMLVIDDDLENSYDELADDIEDLQDEGKIFVINNDTTHKNILYIADVQLPEEFLGPLNETTKQSWNSVPKAVISTIPKLLVDKGIGESKLDCNKHDPILSKQKAKGQRKPRQSKKRAPKGGISAALKKLINTDMANQMGGTCGELTVSLNDEEAEEDDSETPEEAEQKEKAFMSHPSHKNPEEFEAVSEIINIVGRWFYNDVHCVILNAFLKQRFYKESDLVQVLKLPQKQVGQALWQLNEHQLLTKTVCNPAGATGRASSRVFNLYLLDLDFFINSTQHRFYMMKNRLETEIETITSVVLQCTNCSTKYTKADVAAVYNPFIKQYVCRYSECNSPLENVRSDEKVVDLKANLKQMGIDVGPLGIKLEELLKKRFNADKKDINLAKEKASSLTIQAARRNVMRGRKTGTAGGAVGHAGTSIRQRTLEIIELDENADAGYSLQPIVFGVEDNIVFLKISKDMKVHKSDVASLLAKEILDEVAEFKLIVSSHTYIYEINPHSLYLGWSRGYSAKEIVRVLSMLGKNPMPLSLQKLIYENTNNNTYYKATMTVRTLARNSDDKNSEAIAVRHVKSDQKDVIAMLMERQVIRSLIADNSNRMLEISSPLGQYWCFPILEEKNEEVKKGARDQGISLIDEMDYANNTSVPSINIRYRENTALRPYQRFAVSRVFWNKSQAHSGVLVLPCGAGKTLIGISVMAAIKKSTIIFCFSNLALNQWKEQIEKWTSVTPSTDICRFSSQHENEWRPNANIIITTYPMFSMGDGNLNKRKATAKNMIETCQSREWGLMILDEVHLAPAKIFKKIANKMRCHIKLGLTATMVREDDLIQDIPHLVGPKLFDLDIFIPLMYRHIAPVQCTEVRIPLTPVFKRAYEPADARVRKLLWTCNPNKIRVVKHLMTKHLEAGHKIMLFCDILFALAFYEQWLKRPKIEGDTPDRERQEILQNFRKKKKVGDCVLFSTVGDQSIDLPEADVVIQLALTDGSRMQEGQRIGRVQRPEEGKATAYFYSLISEDTSEAEYSIRRRNFLEDNGYLVKVYDSDSWEKLASSKELDAKTQTTLVTEIHNEVTRKANEKTIKSEKKERVAAPKRRPTSNVAELKRVGKRLKQ